MRINAFDLSVRTEEYDLGDEHLFWSVVNGGHAGLATQDMGQIEPQVRMFSSPCAKYSRSALSPRTSSAPRIETASGETSSIYSGYIAPMASMSCEFHVSTCLFAN